MHSISPASLSVLVIDDHMIIRQVFEQNLRNMGFTLIDTAADCTEAQAKMAAKAYDLVFVDWVLPGKSGYALMQECRQEARYDRVAFVMVTGTTDERQMIEAMKAGATACIAKPVAPASFQDKVRRVLDWIAKLNTGAAPANTN